MLATRSTRRRAVLIGYGILVVALGVVVYGQLTIEDLTQRLDRSLDARERLLESVADSPAPASAFGPAAGGVPEDSDDDHA